MTRRGWIALGAIVCLRQTGRALLAPTDGRLMQGLRLGRASTARPYRREVDARPLPRAGGQTRRVTKYDRPYTLLPVARCLLPSRRQTGRPLTDSAEIF